LATGRKERGFRGR